MKAENKRLFWILICAISPLLMPLVAMGFTSEVDWDLSDFAIMGFLLTGAGFLIEMVLRMTKQFQFRFFLIAGLLLALFLIWAELAVGVFGTPFAGS